MSLIKQPNEIQTPRTIKAMIYGQPGTGKTTLALSAPRPLLIDFDKGVRRVNPAHFAPSFQPQTWQEVHQLLEQEQAELQGFATIVVDTIGKLSELIQTYVCGARHPSIKDWDTMNREFKWFTRTLDSLGKHIIFVAHQDSRKEGERSVFVPTLREKWYNIVVTELDLLGYVEMKVIQGQDARTISFAPTEQHNGKNTCNLPSLIAIDNIIGEDGLPTAENDFFTTKIVGRFDEILKQKEEAVKQYQDDLQQLTEDVQGITDATTANAFINHMQQLKGAALIIKARQMFSAKVKELQLTYDKKAKQYTDPEAPLTEDEAV